MNAFLARGAPARQALRLALSRALRTEGTKTICVRTSCRMSRVELVLPCRSATTPTSTRASTTPRAWAGSSVPDNPLLPNYKWVPIGYHGRASSIVVSGTPIVRPHGQIEAAGRDAPVFGPSQRLDYELELGIVVARGNALGSPMPIDDAEHHVFGLALFNDWTARDIQAWEYQPLGPFLAKNFATTISPWIVTMEALAPFRAPFNRVAGDPQPLPYLDSDSNRADGAVDVTLEVWIETAAMRNAGQPAQRLMQSNFRDSYWTLAQLVAHHTVNGCNLHAGRPLRIGHAVRAGARPGRIAPRAVARRPHTSHPAQWRAAKLPRGR